MPASLTVIDFSKDERVSMPASARHEPETVDTMRSYLRGIGRTALLDAAGEVELAKRIEAGLFAAHALEQGTWRGEAIDADLAAELEAIAADGARARTHLLEANLRLVVSLAKKHQGRGLALLDLIQEGNLGLMRAVEKFDYAKGFKFSTYATWWIRQAMSRAIAEQSRTIRLPVHLVEQINRLHRARRELVVELEREPSIAEIAQRADVAEHRVVEMLRYDVEPTSLDATVGDEDGRTLGDFIADAAGQFNPEALLTDSENVSYALLRGKLNRLLSGLGARNRRSYGCGSASPTADPAPSRRSETSSGFPGSGSDKSRRRPCRNCAEAPSIRSCTHSHMRKELDRRSEEVVRPHGR